MLYRWLASAVSREEHCVYLTELAPRFVSGYKCDIGQLNKVPDSIRSRDR